MSILDDARPGMNPDIRPQDDLFGHVNGRWLDETEIPSDRSSWGPFVQLADVAESQVRDIITSIAETPAAELDDEGRKIGDLFASFMDEATHRQAGDAPDPAAGRGGGRPARRPRPGRLPRRVRADRRRRSLRVVRRHRRPQLRSLPLPHHPGRPRPARRELLPRRQVRRGAGEVRRLPHPPPRARRPRRRGRARRRPCSTSTPSWRPATGSARRPATSRRPTT